MTSSMTIEYVTTYWPVIEDTAWNLAFTDNSSTNTTVTDSTSMPIKSGDVLGQSFNQK